MCVSMYKFNLAKTRYVAIKDNIMVAMLSIPED